MVAIQLGRGEMLKFAVKGTTNQYVVTADGRGANLRMFCTCPAGRKGGLFCKHSQALVLGDVTSLLQPSDDVMLLKEAVVGSNYEQKALNHVSLEERRPKVEGMKTIHDVNAKYGDALRNAGYVVELVEETDPWHSVRLNCYGRGKSGKMLKYPVVVLEWEEKIADHSHDEHGKPALIRVRPRVRPYSVRGKKGGNWGDIGKATHAFLIEAGIPV
ncbi:SWIM zinc finger family protein [Rhizobium sp. CFBP 8762]|uniref:SWIM zinc finger family protein n=1 Tax=Rhizobium sp. CFBP 8762 TaxID=2775279 RepID=UPI0017806BAD|nr:SWIM zinc finger family protein [Rhizobium sp. CFBP 8762]MBD8556878.1 SWIM zinc finger family protein [Rhizobium sp. CFBP 8762]